MADANTEYERELAALRATHHTVNTLRAALDALAARGCGEHVIAVYAECPRGGSTPAVDAPIPRGHVIAPDATNPGRVIVPLTDDYADWDGYGRRGYGDDD